MEMHLGSIAADPEDRCELVARTTTTGWQAYAKNPDGSESELDLSAATLEQLQNLVELSYRSKDWDFRSANPRAASSGGRPLDSAYDRSFATATERLLRDLKAAGHTVETPVTGSVIVDGTEVSPEDWDRLAINYSGDLDSILAEIE